MAGEDDILKSAETSSRFAGKDKGHSHKINLSEDESVLTLTSVQGSIVVFRIGKIGTRGRSVAVSVPKGYEYGGYSTEYRDETNRKGKYVLVKLKKKSLLGRVL
jgi:hypothetical protein